MTTLLQYHEWIKARKHALIDFMFSRIVDWPILWTNHPNRITEIALSGTLDYTYDYRDTTAGATATSATVEIYDLDFSALPSFTRLFHGPGGLHSALPDPDPAEFRLQSFPSAAWAMLLLATNCASTVIGTKTSQTWTRPTDTDPWTQLGTDDVTDVFAFYSPRIGVVGNNSDLGGHPVSNGYDSTTPAAIVLDLTVTPFPTYDFSDHSFERLPWNNAWSAESGHASHFNDWISAQNAADGSGHSGSTGLTITFTF